MTKIGRVWPLVLAVAFACSACTTAAEEEATPQEAVPQQAAPQEAAPQQAAPQQAADKQESYSLAALRQDIEKLEKKEVALVGTVVGVCKSGCKMWIADGEYQKGDPLALVRAKDDAFKFEKGSNGKQVTLHGYAVAKYLDYCAKTGEKHEGPMDSCEGPTGEGGGHQTAKKVQDVTFFATRVEYP